MSPPLVTVRRTAPGRRLVDDVERALASDALRGLDAERPTAIKINGNFNRDYPGSNTSPWFLDALLERLRARGFERLTVIEGDLPEFKAERMIDGTAIGAVLRRHGTPFLAIEREPRDQLELPRFLAAQQLLNVPVLHTHGQAVISCATKNLFGLLPVNRRRYHGVLSEKLIELYLRRPCFTIVDGTVGLQGESTRRGDPVRCDLVLAGSDTLAIDVVAARIMGFTPDQVPLLALARARGLCVPGEVRIDGDFTGADLPSHRFELRLGWIRRVANLVARTPLIRFDPLFRLTDPLRVAWHRVNHWRRRRELAAGPWMAYAQPSSDVDPDRAGLVD